LLSSVIEAVRYLDSNATRWVVDADRDAAAEAVTWTDWRSPGCIGCGISHREVREWNRDNRPYDDRA
jgi:hypothetical protein